MLICHVNVTVMLNVGVKLMLTCKLTSLVYHSFV
jgi:hypothetical protein